MWHRQENHTTVTDVSGINFVDLFYSFIFQQSLIKICQFFPNYMVNYQIMHLLHEIRSFFWLGKGNILPESYPHKVLDHPHSPFHLKKVVKLKKSSLINGKKAYFTSHIVKTNSMQDS